MNNKDVIIKLFVIIFMIKKSFGLKIQNNVESVRILLPKERVPE